MLSKYWNNQKELKNEVNIIDELTVEYDKYHIDDFSSRLIKYTCIKFTTFQLFAMWNYWYVVFLNCTNIV